MDSVMLAKQRLALVRADLMEAMDRLTDADLP